MNYNPATDPVVFYLFAIFAGASVLATLALYARQALPVAYIVLGVLLGPFGFAAVDDRGLIAQMAEAGIIFLLFLLGLDLSPQRLWQMLRQATLVTLASALLFALLGTGLSLAFGFALTDSLIVGATMSFSSTILGLKLLPTTALHHQHTGEVIISILLLQDLLAIALLLVIGSSKADTGGAALLALAALPALIAAAFVFERLVLIKLLRRFNKIREYLFLTAIGWCLGLAELAALLGLSHEVGAFIAGVTLASSPIALYIADSLRPLRDFFLVLFFFSLGASFDLTSLAHIGLPAALLAMLMLAAKPWTFKRLLVWAGETPKLAFEVGVRLGQISEFSLLIAVLALQHNLLSSSASYLIQAATLLSFVASTYYIVMNYPTPIAVSDELRRD